MMSAEKEGCHNIGATAIRELKNDPNRKSWDHEQRARQFIMKLKEEHRNDIPVPVLQLIRIIEKIDESLNCYEASTSKQDLLQGLFLAVEYILGDLKQKEVVNADVPTNTPKIESVAVADASSLMIQASKNFTTRLNAQQSLLNLETQSGQGFYQSYESEDERDEKMKRKNNDLFASSPNKRRRFSLEYDADGFIFNKSIASTSDPDPDTKTK